MVGRRSPTPSALPPGHLGDEVLYDRQSSAVVRSLSTGFLIMVEQPLIFTFAGLVAYGASPGKDAILARGIIGGAAASGGVCAIIRLLIWRAMFALDHVKAVPIKASRADHPVAVDRESNSRSRGIGKLREANNEEGEAVCAQKGQTSVRFGVSLSMYLLWLTGSYTRVLLSAVIISSILDSKFQLGCKA